MWKYKQKIGNKTKKVIGFSQYGRIKQLYKQNKNLLLFNMKKKKKWKGRLIQNPNYENKAVI
jgi:hypothetical protein